MTKQHIEQTIKQHIHQALLILKEDGPLYISEGICYNVYVTEPCLTAWNYKYNAYLEDLFETWPKFSGNWSFPVPHSHLDPETAFYDYSINMWEGEYGDLRKELLNFLIEQTK